MQRKEVPNSTARVQWFEDCKCILRRKLSRGSCFFGQEELEGLDCVVVMADQQFATQRIY